MSTDEMERLLEDARRLVDVAYQASTKVMVNSQKQLVPRNVMIVSLLNALSELETALFWLDRLQ